MAERSDGFALDKESEGMVKSWTSPPYKLERASGRSGALRDAQRTSKTALTAILRPRTWAASKVMAEVTAPSDEDVGAQRREAMDLMDHFLDIGIPDTCEASVKCKILWSPLARDDPLPAPWNGRSVNAMDVSHPATGRSPSRRSSTPSLNTKVRSVISLEAANRTVFLVTAGGMTSRAVVFLSTCPSLQAFFPEVSLIIGTDPALFDSVIVASPGDATSHSLVNRNQPDTWVCLIMEIHHGRDWSNFGQYEGLKIDVSVLRNA